MEVLGERWTLLVVRELLVGSRKFNDIARGVPGMSRTMLTKRLRHLEAMGLVDRLDNQYLPTEACEELRPAVLGLGQWAAKWLLGDPTADECDALLLMWWAHSRLDTSQLPADRRTVIKFHFTDVVEQFWVVIEPAGHRSVSQIPVLTPTPPSRPRHRYCTTFGTAARPSPMQSSHRACGSRARRPSPVGSPH